MREFFRRKFVEILVERIARVDAVLDSIETRDKQRGESEIWICGRVRRAEFDALRLRIWRIGRNPDCGRAIARANRRD